MKVQNRTGITSKFVCQSTRVDRCYSSNTGLNMFSKFSLYLFCDTICCTEIYISIFRDTCVCVMCFIHLTSDVSAIKFLKIDQHLVSPQYIKLNYGNPYTIQQIGSENRNNHQLQTW